MRCVVCRECYVARASDGVGHVQGLQWVIGYQLQRCQTGGGHGVDTYTQAEQYTGCCECGGREEGWALAALRRHLAVLRACGGGVVVWGASQ